MTFKTRVNSILVKVGLRKMLPSEVINNIKIADNNDKLVRIDEDRTMFFDKDITKPVYLRETVFKMLKTAQKELVKQQLTFKVYCGYRSLSSQKEIWQKVYCEILGKYPDGSQEEIEKLTKRRVAKPGDGEFGGHQTGGAVDISLCTVDGKEIKMGTKYIEFNNKTKTESEDLTKEEAINRRRLLSAMTKVGFVNYPNEWWHYCYGDRMWAAYSNKKKAIYGYVETETKE